MDSVRVYVWDNSPFRDVYNNVHVFIVFTGTVPTVLHLCETWAGCRVVVGVLLAYWEECPLVVFVFIVSKLLFCGGSFPSPFELDSALLVGGVLP